MKKGQIISLDFLISLGLIFFAFGTLIEFSELNSYAQKQENEMNELRMVGETAADLLVSHPALICEVTDDRDENKTLSYLNNCLGKGKKTPLPPDWAPAWGRRRKEVKVIWKQFLGIPEDFDCLLSIEGGGIDKQNEMIVTDCQYVLPPNVKNYYSASRDVVVISDKQKYTIKKSSFIACQEKDPNCKLIGGKITVTVWKK